MSIKSFEIVQHLSPPGQVDPVTLPPGVDDEFVFDAFLLRPENRLFLINERPRPAGYPGRVWIIALLFALALLTDWLLFDTLPGWQDRTVQAAGETDGADTDYSRLLQTLLNVGMAGSALVGLIVVVRRRRQYTALMQRGQVLVGDVLAFDDGIRAGSLRAALRYRFVSPAGCTIVREVSRPAKEFENRVPAPGSPVAVLYVNDRTFMIL